MNQIYSRSSWLLIAVLTSSYSLADDSILFTPEQQQRIGEIASQYLVDHPEFLIEASQKF